MIRKNVPTHLPLAVFVLVVLSLAALTGCGSGDSETGSAPAEPAKLYKTELVGVTITNEYGVELETVAQGIAGNGNVIDFYVS
ncbi:hypothetical protein B5F74_02210 [Collinsella sp. An271]|uniref:hypothetical protein n=1 Tax=Collinsella sp. An271 TaxID=1965616 RepID=UPI000B38D380|nr:hypothetical protein [Collinsella sp. An271]OUO62046.1 hypothetical protein B5F74_02210 [Collinsella sp. An271]